jgi:AcrR family transcriptional regulator
VLEVARRLFAERGYAETTMEAIATEAGVSVPTVYAAFQSKRGVLSALLARLVSGEKGASSPPQPPGVRRVMAETDPRRMLALFVTDLCGVQERVVPTYEVLKSAARTEPDVAELLTRMQSKRYANLSVVPARLEELGALRPGLSRDDAARTLWAIASPEVRWMLLTFAGWSPERYRDWLDATLVAVFLPPIETPRPKRG